MFRVLALMVSLGLGVLTPADTRADAPPPPGKRYAEVRHLVQGASSVPSTHTLALVTTRRSEPGHLRVRWSGFEGAVDVPSGYMLVTRFVALTEPQQKELARLYIAALPADDATRKALEAAAPEAVAALMAKTDIDPREGLAEVVRFLARDDLAASPELDYRTTVDDEFEGPVTESWRIEGIKDGHIAMGPAIAEKKSGGKSACEAGGGLDVQGALLALGLVAWRARRRRGPGALGAR